MTKHEELFIKWDLCEFGVKTRVFNEYSSQQIDYIRKHPNYRDAKKMQDILDCIERNAQEVLEEITEMYNQISA